MRDFFSYLASKVFFKHLAISLLSLFLVLWVLFKLLDVYTHHGEVAIVPDFSGKSLSELDAFVNGKNVGYTIIDSIYDPAEKPGIVIRQEPEANSEVKHNRMIYLYVTSTQPPQMEMPKLVDRSTRQALTMIESYGLKHGKITEVFADCNGCVIKQLYNGAEIKPGDAIKKGSKIDLIVGKKENQYSTAATDTTNTAGDDNEFDE